jgi:hypothetical protein
MHFLDVQFEKEQDIKNQFNTVFSRKVREEILSKSVDQSIKDDKSESEYSQGPALSENMFDLDFVTRPKLNPIKNKK